MKRTPIGIREKILGAKSSDEILHLQKKAEGYDNISSRTLAGVRRAATRRRLELEREAKKK